jgi:hypothetical protein
MIFLNLSNLCFFWSYTKHYYTKFKLKFSPFLSDKLISFCQIIKALILYNDLYFCYYMHYTLIVFDIHIWYYLSFFLLYNFI